MAMSFAAKKKPVGTITKIGRKFWSTTEEFGIKSYSYAGSFPDWFEFKTLSNAKNRIGNCVPPKLMEAVAKHIHKEILSKVS
ncbi:MAG: DNA cytosine methyltransferase [Hyphomicrobiaceae bacterium]|nr:MAG: DNA cytosine methyltransferase [Hyphomicrobiaceae bacterium]